MSQVTSFIGDTLGGLIGGVTGASQQAEAAQAAAETQAGFAQQGIDEQRRQFDSLVKLLSPYVNAGNQAVTAQQNLMGLGGQDAQRQAIEQLQNSYGFANLAQQGENALLQNASATGGLRGGNAQNALANYRTNLLNSMIQQQYGNLGGLASLGQSSAAMTGNSGMNMALNIGNLYGQQGAALAGGQLAQGGVVSSAMGSLSKGAGAFAGIGGLSGIAKLF